MRLSALNKLKHNADETLEHADTDRDARLIDGRLLFNQRDTARLLGISSRALSDWPIEPTKREHRAKLFYWPDVLELAKQRGEAGLYSAPAHRLPITRSIP